MSLEEIAKKHRTAKVPHGYMPIYEKYFESIKEQSITLVEIGIAEGASLRTWADYFNRAHIIGLEKDLDAVDRFNKSYPQGQGVIAIECDANDRDSITRALDKVPKIDVVIDDGSHWAHEQMNAFKALWDKLKPGGLYVVEDLFTLYDPVWNPKPHYSIIDEIKNRIQSILVEGDSIQEVYIYGRNNINGIMFLRKRSEEFRIQPLEEFNV